MIFKSIITTISMISLVTGTAYGTECEHYEAIGDDVTIQGVKCDGNFLGTITYLFSDGLKIETETDFLSTTDFETITAKRSMPDGSWQEGTFQGGDFIAGKIKYIFESGNYYEGDWSHNDFNGNGTRTFSNGKYVGEFRNGERHGTGRYTFDDGDYKDGQWENGDLVNGTSTFSDGKYVGNFRNGDFHGSGRLSFDDGSYQDGEWAYDEMVSGTFKEIDGRSVIQGNVRGGEITSGRFDIIDDGQRLRGRIYHNEFDLESCTWVRSGNSCNSSSSNDNTGELIGTILGALINEAIK